MSNWEFLNIVNVQLNCTINYTVQNLEKKVIYKLHVLYSDMS